jgi:anti-sigma-K factor RskA
MIALGALTSGSQGRFTIPPGTNLAQYTIVDVSVESFDGDPAHSKQSMLRGTLDV